MVVESALIGKQVYFGQKILHGNKIKISVDIFTELDWGCPSSNKDDS